MAKDVLSSLPKMRTIHAIGCLVCDSQFFGPAAGYYGPQVGEVSVWEYLRAEAEDLGWFTVSVGEHSALVCSVSCAEKWLRGDYDRADREWVIDDRPSKASVIRNAIAKRGDTEFQALDILSDARQVRDDIRHADLYQLLSRMVQKSTLVKRGTGTESVYHTPRDEDAS